MRILITILAAGTVALAACGSEGGDVATPGAGDTTTPVEPTAAADTTTAPATTAAPTTATPDTTVAPTTAAPTTAAPTTAAPTTAPAPTLSVCAGTEPPSGAPADTSLTLDLRDDGTADDLVEGYFTATGAPRMRVTTGEGVYSEVASVTDGRYRPLGVAPIFPGGPAELIAVTGEGDVAIEIGFFTLDGSDCLVPYAFEGDPSGEFRALIRPDRDIRAGVFCYDGGIALYGAELFDDGWAAYGAGYRQRSATELEYEPASDDYEEGLDESELAPFELDCFGVTLTSGL